jgi:hypothetical protein
MNAFLITVHLGVALLLSGLAQAQTAAFELYIREPSKTAELDFESGFGLTINTFENQQPRYDFGITGAVHGLKLAEFEYPTEETAGDVSEDDLKAFLAAAKKLPQVTLASKDDDHAPRGWVSLEGKKYPISPHAKEASLKAWKDLVESFVRAHPSDWATGKRRVKVQGEATVPAVIRIEELVENPEKFDGRRVRVRGYYHTELECNILSSGFPPDPGFRHAVWMGGWSSLARMEPWLGKPGKLIEVEGTFGSGPGHRGHMGAYVGDIFLITSQKVVPE